MGKAVETDHPSGRGCFYVGELNGVRYSVGIDLQRIEPGSTTQHERSHRQTAEKYGFAESIVGLGDSAFFSTTRHPHNKPDSSHMLYVRGGELAFQIYAEGVSGTAKMREGMIEQAHTILRKLST